jgi:hypothetical protein
MRRRTGPIALVLVAALGAAGCGGDDKKSDAAQTTPTAPSDAPALGVQQTAPAEPAKAGSAEEAARRLRSSGYTVSQLDVNPPARAARKVGDHVLLYEYADGDAAKAGASVITGAIKDRPERGVVDTEGRRVYFLGEARAVTAREKAAFADLVDVGEGR